MNESKLSPYHNPEDVIIVIMDLQERLLPSIQNKDNLVDSNKILIQASALLELPIVVTEQVPEKLGHTVAGLFKDDAGFQLFEKATFSGFGSNAFREMLNISQTKHIVLCGIETPICIYQTAMDALSLGYAVTILEDCVGARRETDSSRCLSQLVHSGVSAIPMETFLYQHLQSSNHPNFKDISSLIRSRN
jgi:nicotinamidase-related amidase